MGSNPASPTHYLWLENPGCCGSLAAAVIIMIKGLAHLCLFSSDLERTEAFYCRVLGLSVQFRLYRGAEVFGFYLKVAESQFIERCSTRI